MAVDWVSTVAFYTDVFGFYCKLGPVGVSAVDVRDIAEAAAIALTSDRHLAKTYNLVGPDILSGNLAASIWTNVLGKEVRYYDSIFNVNVKRPLFHGAKGASAVAGRRFYHLECFHRRQQRVPGGQRL